jgi:hypothetical protein
MDSQGIIICLFIVTRAIIDGMFNMDSQLNLPLMMAAVTINNHIIIP